MAKKNKKPKPKKKKPLDIKKFTLYLTAILGIIQIVNSTFELLLKILSIFL